MLNKLIQTKPDAAPAILRLALGAVFFAHGATKVLGWWGGYGFSAAMRGFEHRRSGAVRFSGYRRRVLRRDRPDHWLAGARGRWTAR